MKSTASEPGLSNLLFFEKQNFGYYFLRKTSQFFILVVFECLFGGIANQVRNKKFCMFEFK